MVFIWRFFDYVGHKFVLWENHGVIFLAEHTDFGKIWPQIKTFLSSLYLNLRQILQRPSYLGEGAGCWQKNFISVFGLVGFEGFQQFDLRQHWFKHNSSANE